MQKKEKKKRKKIFNSNSLLQMSIARLMNSLALTVDASRKDGTVMDKMIAAIIPMKVTTARKTLVRQTIISIAVIMSVFPTRGNAMALLTALTDRTKR
jgi:hypothetical protein